jgi:uncharacterized protein (DUF4415 family)
MKKEYDFSKAKRGPIVTPKEKTRITIYLDDDVLEEFRNRSNAVGKGYQTMINEALREYLGKEHGPIDEDTLRRVIREELKNVG